MNFLTWWKVKNKWVRFGQFILIGIGLVLALGLLSLAIRLQDASKQPVSALLVLGGSIKREIYTTEIIQKYPQAKVLISNGSKDPCIWLIFKEKQAPMEQVWLEKCAKNTFDNFFYGTTILRQWGVKKVKLITSATHLPRAQWLAQIQLGAHGIWVETEITPETGVPGNRESALKTALDVTRSLIWSIVSQKIQPACTQVIRLVEINKDYWRKKGFKCEYQAHLDEAKF